MSYCRTATACLTEQILPRPISPALDGVPLFGQSVALRTFVAPAPRPALASRTLFRHKSYCSRFKKKQQ